MAKHIQTIAQEILDQALQTYEAYPANQFEAAVGCPFHAVSGGKVPTEPGQRAYTIILSQDFEKGALSLQDTRQMARVNRTSVMAGLTALFPEEALQEALSNALENFTFMSHQTEDRPYAETSVMPAVVPASHGNKSHSSSPMHIDRDFHTAEFGDDRDRRNTNLTNEELIGSYELMRDHPEYGLAVKWIANTVTDLGRTIQHELDTNPTYAHLKDSGLYETLDLITNDGALALLDGRLPVAVSAQIAQKMTDDTGLTAPEQMSDAIRELTTVNVFKRPRQNAIGEKFVGLCPATRFNMMCLATDLDGEPAMAQFIEKLQSVADGLDPNTQDQDHIDVLTAQHEFSTVMGDMLKTPEAIEAQAEITLRRSIEDTALGHSQKRHI